jgi:hypothetical protein
MNLLPIDESDFEGILEMGKQPRTLSNKLSYLILRSQRWTHLRDRPAVYTHQLGGLRGRRLR